VQDGHLVADPARKRDSWTQGVGVITTKTVLVLGAGASAPYGFPTGKELVKRILEFVTPPQSLTWCAAFHEWVQAHAAADAAAWAGIAKEMKSLSRALLECRPRSIDEFLERRQDVAAAGRLAISVLLLSAEAGSEQPLRSDETKGHWYDDLKSQLVNPSEQLGRDQLRIITFNYERSLEHYLYRSLKPYYNGGITDEDYGNALRQIRFLHIYGSLGPLSWQSGAGVVPYAARGYGHILNAVRGIKVLHEGVEDDVQQNFQTAQDWLQWADRILFFGFGFHRDNVERLGLNDCSRIDHKDIRATCLGLDLTSRDGVEWLWRPRHQSPVIQFAPSGADCCRFLHDHVVLS